MGTYLVNNLLGMQTDDSNMVQASLEEAPEGTWRPLIETIKAMSLRKKTKGNSFSNEHSHVNSYGLAYHYIDTQSVSHNAQVINPKQQNSCNTGNTHYAKII